jgi:hypothetical protein
VVTSDLHGLDQSSAARMTSDAGIADHPCGDALP